MEFYLFSNIQSQRYPNRIDKNFIINYSNYIFIFPFFSLLLFSNLYTLRLVIYWSAKVTHFPTICERKEVTGLFNMAHL